MAHASAYDNGRGSMEVKLVVNQSGPDGTADISAVIDLDSAIWLWHDLEQAIRRAMPVGTRNGH